MEMKEIYMAPEVEILCFQPVETLANLATNWSWGSGTVGGDENEGDDFLEFDSNTDSEEAEDP